MHNQHSAILIKKTKYGFERFMVDHSSILFLKFVDHEKQLPYELEVT